MTIIIMERAPASLRGELTRWFLEPKAGVFVGNCTAMVRERLWVKVRGKVKDGACMLIWSTNTEQGFQIESWGDMSRKVTDWDGLQLITRT